MCATDQLKTGVIFILLCTQLQGCGYRSLNTITAAHCPSIATIEVNNQSALMTLKPRVYASLHRHFDTDAEGGSNRVLRAVIHPIGSRIGAFRSNHQLALSTNEVRISVDLVHGTRILWSAQNQKQVETIRHVANAKETTLLGEDVIGVQVENAVKSLGESYREFCIRHKTQDVKP